MKVLNTTVFSKCAKEASTSTYHSSTRQILTLTKPAV